MAKTGAERVREYRVRNRRHARAVGLCITCFKQPVKENRSVCEACSREASQRTIQRRARLRESQEFHQIVEAHERAGDKAQEHHLFDDAVRHFQEALSVTAIAPDNRIRLLEKLGSASLLSDNPTAATQWRHDRLDAYVSDPLKAEKAVEALLQIARQRWIDAKSPDAVTICTRAVQIAESSGINKLQKVATLRLIRNLVIVDRFDDAVWYLENLGEIGSSDDLSIRVSYYFEKGCLAAKYGKREEAYDNLGKSMSLAKSDTDLYRTMAVVSDYAICAVILGDIERGKALYEQALLMVRRNHMGWLVPQLCMGYAGILVRMGQYATAHNYLREALASDVHAPLVEERFAAVGIPLAIHLNDQATLQKCTRPAAVDLAFQSHESSRIGPVIAAFASLYVTQGRLKKAHVILHKALDFITYIDESIDLPLAVARYGAFADIPRARMLLERRCRRPSADVAEACLLLFDAFVQQRMRKQKEAEYLAVQAAERFDLLHWYAYSDLARSRISLTQARPTPSVTRERPFSASLLHLTKREQQVVEFILRGQTNRQIAERLAIREHTVEKHVGSIMNRFGIRSRYQLADALPELPGNNYRNPA